MSAAGRGRPTAQRQVRGMMGACMRSSIQDCRRSTPQPLHRLQCREAESGDVGEEQMLYLKDGKCEPCPGLKNPFTGPCKACEGSRCTLCADGHYLDSGACKRGCGCGLAWGGSGDAYAALLHPSAAPRPAPKPPAHPRPRRCLQPARMSCARRVRPKSASSARSLCTTPRASSPTLLCSWTRTASARGDWGGSGQARAGRSSDARGCCRALALSAPHGAPPPRPAGAPHIRTVADARLVALMESAPNGD